MLARMSRSAITDDFVLKGGMLLASFGTRRPTVDADAPARNMASDTATTSFTARSPHELPSSRALNGSSLVTLIARQLQPLTDTTETPRSNG